MKKIVCKLCIAQHGLRGSDLANWPNEDDPGAEEWFFNHLETVHEVPVQRSGETREEAIARVSSRREAGHEV